MLMCLCDQQNSLPVGNYSKGRACTLSSSPAYGQFGILFNYFTDLNQQVEFVNEQDKEPSDESPNSAEVDAIYQDQAGGENGGAEGKPRIKQEAGSVRVVITRRLVRDSL